MSGFSHPSTNEARPCLASEIRRDGRIQGGMAIDWILISSSPLSLLQYVASIEGYEENLVSPIRGWKVLGNPRGL